MFFDSWDDIVTTLISAVAGYTCLILILRLSGKRTLSKLNAFDLVVTFAIGSTIATLILTKDVSIAEGVIAIATLVLLHFIVAQGSTLSAVFRKAARSEPAIIVLEGRTLDEEAARQRITGSEIYQAVRSSGIGDLGKVAAVILETDGSLSVIATDKMGTGSALTDIREWDELRSGNRPEVR